MERRIALSRESMNIAKRHALIYCIFFLDNDRWPTDEELEELDKTKPPNPLEIVGLLVVIIFLTYCGILLLD